MTMKTADNRRLSSDFGAHAGHFIVQLWQNPKTNARMALAVTSVLAILVTYSAAKLIWTFFSPQQDATTTVTLSTKPTEPVKAANLADVAALHLFGKADDSKAISPAPIVAPETRLRLVLSGVFASDNPATSMAIIAEKGSKEKTYFKGDSLPGNASLHEIYADRVILSRNGKLETLRLLQNQAKIKTEARPSRPASRPRSPRGSNKPKPGINKIAQLRQQAKTDMTTLMKQIRITPVMKDKQLQGYRFSHRDRSLMREIGLQPQDIITSVNGTPVSNVATMIRMLGNNASLQELNISVLRRGRPQTVIVKLN